MHPDRRPVRSRKSWHGCKRFLGTGKKERNGIWFRGMTVVIVWQLDCLRLHAPPREASEVRDIFINDGYRWYFECSLRLILCKRSVWFRTDIRTVVVGSFFRCDYRTRSKF